MKIKDITPSIVDIIKIEDEDKLKGKAAFYEIFVYDTFERESLISFLYRNFNKSDFVFQVRKLRQLQRQYKESPHADLLKLCHIEAATVDKMLETIEKQFKGTQGKIKT